MTGFVDVIFPTNVSRGARGGPYRPVEIYTLADGREARNARRYHSRRRYEVGVGVRKPDDIAEILEFYEALGGALNSFRYKDWGDCKSCYPQKTISANDQLVGTGDGSNVSFQLVKRYAAGAREYVRDITKPVAGTTQISLGGAITAGFSVDGLTGIVTFATPPAAGVEIWAGYEFHVPVRFEGDEFIEQLNWDCGHSVPNISLVEVVGE